jgi:hypothetical protein
VLSSSSRYFLCDVTEYAILVEKLSTAPPNLFYRGTKRISGRFISNTRHVNNFLRPKDDQRAVQVLFTSLVRPNSWPPQACLARRLHAKQCTFRNNSTHDEPNSGKSSGISIERSVPYTRTRRMEPLCLVVLLLLPAYPCLHRPGISGVVAQMHLFGSPNAVPCR